jgi:hypothetical protein
LRRSSGGRAHCYQNGPLRPLLGRDSAEKAT